MPRKGKKKGNTGKEGDQGHQTGDGEQGTASFSRQQQNAPHPSQGRVPPGRHQNASEKTSQMQGRRQTPPIVPSGAASTAAGLQDQAAASNRPIAYKKAPAPKRQQQPTSREDCGTQNIEKRMETLTIRKNVERGMMPPEKRKDGSFSPTLGRPCKLEANHFILEALRKIKDLYVYSITVVPPWKRPYSKKDTELYREVFQKWLRQCPEVCKFSRYCFAFNGNNMFYSTERIEKISDVVDIVMPGDAKEQVFKVTDVKLTEADEPVIQVSSIMAEFKNSGRRAFNTQLGLPQHLLNAIDVVIKQAIYDNKNNSVIGRSYFSQKGRTIDVGNGKEVWIGTFASMRPYGWKNGDLLLSLNADVANKPATVNLHLTQESKRGAKDSYIHEILGKRRAGAVDFNRKLMDRDVDVIENDLKGLKVRYELPTGIVRCYRVNKLVQCARDMRIPGLDKTVEQYFKTEHKVLLKYPLMPCLHLGSLQKTIFIPAEYCRMEKQPLPRGKKLPDEAVAKMIRFTATKPDERRKKILHSMEQTNNFYKNDEYCKTFGISFETKMTEITGRILPPPSIGYKGFEKNPASVVSIDQRSPGSWRQERNMRYVDGKAANGWAVLDFCNLGGDFHAVVDTFSRVGRDVGVTISNDPNNIWHQRCEDPRKVEENFKTIVDAYKKDNIQLDLILVVFEFKNGPTYDSVKRLGDIECKVPTQCVLRKTLFRDGQVNRQVVENICLKINSKLGGINHVLANGSKPCLIDNKLVMVMGADVSHPAPESKGEKPSLVSVVASVDPKASIYECETRIQNPDKNEEIILDMKDITAKLLMKFYNKTNGQKPQQIIMYRDGVSEGQFLKVLAHEIIAMRAACASINPSYQPPITFIVVQKRHHTRLFPMDNNKYARNGNVLAGTYVSNGLNHPTEADWFLVSHEGIQGTSRPTHYQVLWDDADLKGNDLVQLTYYLCHLYSRCKRSVSYPAPTYYSHLAADRARKHHNDMMQKRQTTARDVKEKIEGEAINVMYFV